MKYILNKRVLLVVFGLVLAGLITAFFINDKSKFSTIDSQNLDKSSVNIKQVAKKSGQLKIFSGEEFKNLYASFAHPNTSKISESTEILGDIEADDHLRALAIKRGYVLQSAPVTNNFVEVEKRDLLQPLAAKDWRALQRDAANNGLRISVLAAFRSADEQRSIFLDRLGAVDPAKVNKGVYDTKISTVLKTTALPGYSRHHSGYTIDIACDSQPNVIFEKSSCFAWLSAENYKNAKNRGLIPSYPDKAGKQGPDPEPWEYIWVGRDSLTD